MKTAISIPEAVFQAAEKAARRMSMSRSQFYTKAVESFVASLSESEVTTKLNELYSRSPAVLDPLVAELQSQSLAYEEW
jgi:metal-responsive CopG/Arc/MetJ family transcriptional regulator